MINKDFFQALEDLEREKNINAEQFILSLEAALTSAYKKMFGEAKNALVKLNPEKATIKIYSFKTVVEEVADSDKEISLADAKLIKKSYAIGDQVAEEVSTKEFGRIAAQTAKQVVMQKLKELEREQALSEIAEKEDELITTIVKRVENGTVYVQLAGSNMEGVMLENDQIPGEKYVLGQRIKVYVKKIKDSYKGPQVQVSRSNNGFVKKLFEIEVPEIASGDVVIKNIARDAGNRSKVAIYSTKAHIDALGACVGNRGVRINTIMGELNGEKIDLVMFVEDPLEYIANALAPAEVLSVEINESLKASQVIVPDEKLSLAIGKSGQNVRLAARLTGWKIDVKSKSKAEGQNIELPEYEITELDDEDNFADLEDIT
ncbi:MAG: transcription termination/antitermination protein NusA [Clostridiales bacterium]|nr:transcription termination/antitermination protein NusA [Clostridiales bacterium]